MTSAKIDTALRKIGYFLVRRSHGEDRWEVRNIRTFERKWTCANLKEARSLLQALQEREERGGRADIYWDGDGWACADEAF